MKRTPTEWSKIFKVIILDPDGWDRQNFDTDWKKPLTRKQFEKKMIRSTIRNI